MTSKKEKDEIEPYNPFGDGTFNDGAVWELDHQLVTGEISFEEYKRKIEKI